MALTHLHLAILVGLSFVCSSYAAANASSVMPAVKTLIDPKRRNDLVDEAFLEQKDVLLDMLETKLKEVRDKKKKKGDSVNSNYSSNGDTVKCEALPNNVDLNLNAHGISAIGEADVKLKFGNTGNGTLNLDATGISNIGQTRVELGIGDGSVHIPGLNNIFVGPSFLKKGCETVNQPNTTSSTTKTNAGIVEIKEIDGRRINNDKVNETLNATQNTVTENKAVLTDDKLSENNTLKEIQDINRNDSSSTSNVVTATTNPNEIVTSPNLMP